MLEGDFHKDDSNELLNMCYNNMNYRIIHGLGKDVCYVFCSGNGLYFPDDYTTFQDTILYKDRYEWGRIAASLVEVAEKIILIRDIRKSWYVTGINSEINTIDRLIDLVAEECKGYRTVVAGSSAGGYIAMLLGSMVNAEAVFSWGGQTNLYDLEDVLNEYFYIKKYSLDQEYRKYYDISPYIGKMHVPIFYFYGVRCVADINQLNYIRYFKNIFPFAIDSEAHATGLTRDAYLALLSSTRDEVFELWRNYKEKIWNTKELCDFIIAKKNPEK